MEIKKVLIPNLGTLQTIENIYPINAPDGTVAISIEGLKLSNFNYPIVVQKNLHSIGDKVVYIKWDSCLPNTELFQSFIAPDGNPRKSILGSNNRVRVAKLAGNYSYGIVLPLKEVEESLKLKLIELVNDDDLVFDFTEKLGLYKTEQIHDNYLIKGDIPSFLYKTDEPNIYDVDKHGKQIKELIDELHDRKEEIQFTVKKDGRSVTIYSTPTKNGICTRTSELKKISSLDDIPFHLKVLMVQHKLKQSKVGSKGEFLMKDISKEDFDKFINDKAIWKKRGNENKKKVKKDYRIYQNIINGKSPKSRKHITEYNLKLRLDPAIEANNDFNYLSVFDDYCKKHNVNLALRGELLGYAEGSQNKKNPDKNNKKVIWYGLDVIDPIAERVPTNDIKNLYTICKELQFAATPIVKKGALSYDEIIEFSEEFFKDNYVEGLVIRTTYNNKLSCKLINSQYDAG